MDSHRLQRAALHVRFEVERLRACLTIGLRTTSGVHTVDAIAREAALVHYRNLMDFFWPKGDSKGRDDILAEHFLQTGSSWTAEEPAGLDLAKERERLNKLLAHLTYKRIVFQDEGNMTWDFDNIGSLLRVWDDFLLALSPQRRSFFQDGEPTGQLDGKRLTGKWTSL